MTATTADLASHQDAELGAQFEVRATVVRYIRADDASDAERIASAGLHLVGPDHSLPAVSIDTITASRPYAVPYHHCGQHGLWRVGIDVSATLHADNEISAAEATHLLVSIGTDGAQSDAFEFELDVQPPRRVG